jgi:Sec-independent protein translocase protein TatA
MEIFGVGGMELVVFLLIALIVAGPKRMIAWSYTLGKWASKARQMWSETAAMLQKELDSAGVDIKVPTEPPTRQNLTKSINSEVKRLANPVTKPVEEAMTAVKTEVDAVKQATGIGKTSLNTPMPRQVVPDNPASSENGNAPASAPTNGSSAPAASSTPAQTKNDDAYGTWSSG